MSNPYFWGEISYKRISTCHPKLQQLLKKLIQKTPFDITVVWGWRGEDEQNRAYELGNSTKIWQESKHNHVEINKGVEYPCSLAVDLAPYPINWKDKTRFILMAGVVMMVAKEENTAIRWGGEWGDYGHFELMGEV